MMAISKTVYEVFPRGASETKTSNSIKRVFMVEWATLQDPNESKTAIEPKIDDEHPTIKGIILIAIDVQIEKDNIHKVTCSYGIEETSQIDLAWGSWTYNKVIVVDADGDEINKNSAGDIFANPITKDYYNLQLTISRDEVDFSPDFSSIMQQTINENEIIIAGKTCEPKTMLLTSYTAKQNPKDETWRATLILRYKPDTWVLKILDAGLNQLIAGKLTPITAPNQRAVTAPVKLKDGLELPSGVDPVFLDKNIYALTDFKSLGLPS